MRLLKQTQKRNSRVVCFHKTQFDIAWNASRSDWKSFILAKEYTDLGNRLYCSDFENKGSVMGCSNPHPRTNMGNLLCQLKWRKTQNNLRPILTNTTNLLQDYVRRAETRRTHCNWDNHLWHWFLLGDLALNHDCVSVNVNKITDFTEAGSGWFAVILKQLTTNTTTFWDLFPYSSGFINQQMELHPDGIFTCILSTIIAFCNCKRNLW
jgi:UDPglucose--hexose-1-phosphate uridylyltransferase